MTVVHSSDGPRRGPVRRRRTARGHLARLGAASLLVGFALTGGAALAADITGSEGPDTIKGTPQDDAVDALGGNDTVAGLGGDDVIDGGAGRDSLSGGPGVDRITGGVSDDTLAGGPGRDGLVGDGGADVIDGGGGDDFTLAGAAGDDTVFGRDGADTLDGDDGDDALSGGNGEDTLFGLDGNDDLVGNSGPDEQFGGEGDDRLNGGPGNDELEGEEGADESVGGTGNDELSYFTSAFQPDSTFAVRDVVLDFEGAGATGGDRLRLSGGGDGFAWVGRVDVPLRVGAGLPGGSDGLTQLGYVQTARNTSLVSDTNDDGLLDADDATITFRGLLDLTLDDFTATDFIIAGTTGDDVIVGTARDDRIFASAGNDQVSARSGSDEVYGGPGRDVLDGGPGGFDNLFGEGGGDELTLASSNVGGVASGGPGPDVLFGSDTSFSNFDNSLQGNEGDDDLFAGAVGTSMDAGSGSDRVVSAAAEDQLDGGRLELSFDLDGAPDLFVYTGTGRWSPDGGNGDTVSSFQDGSDLFDLRGSGLQLADLTIVNDDFQTVITSARGTITIFESSGQEVFVDGEDFLF